MLLSCDLLQQPKKNEYTRVTMREVFKIVLDIRSEFSNLSLFYGGDEIGDYHFFYDQFYSFLHQIISLKAVSLPWIPC